MQKIEIKPLQGIIIENIGTVLLGQCENELHTLLGPPSITNGNQVFYNDLEVRFDLNSFQKIELIEFIYGPFPEKTELLIYDVNPFTIGANNLVDILSYNNQGEIDTSEAPYCYCFLNTSIGIWRESTVENLEYEHAVNTEDFKMAQSFWTIGIGITGYYK